MTFVVKAESHEGKTLTLRGGFATRDDAEDHPVQMSLWKRVWVEGAASPPPAPPTPTLPPLPWDWVSSTVTDARGSFHAYLVDATGRKIAAIWGREGEKALIADTIIQQVNSALLSTETDRKGADNG